MSSPPDNLPDPQGSYEPDPDAMTEQIPAYTSPYEDSTGEVSGSSTFADPSPDSADQSANPEGTVPPSPGVAPYPASDTEEPKSFSRTQKVIGGGCGVLLLFTIIGGCAAIFGPDVDKNKEAPTSTEVVTSTHTTEVEPSYTTPTTSITIPASEPIPEKLRDLEPVREDAECSEPNKLGIDEETHYVLICNEESKKWSISVFPDGYVEPAGLGEVEAP